MAGGGARSGRVERPVALSWEAIEGFPATEIRSRSHAEDTMRASHVASWRGPRLDALIDRASPAPDAREVTLIAADGFRATFELADLRRWPILLAYELDGRPLPRDAGGPLQAVFPIGADHPELAGRYDGRWWVFYVTHAIVDTEEPRLAVGARVLDRAALEALPRTSIVETVGYRVGWPSEPVALEGVRLRDLLEAAGETLARGQHVRVRSHAPISRGDDRPTRIRAEDALEQDVIVALWSAGEPISARLGGPMTLAFPASVGAHLADHDWLTFVDAIEVEP
jgi:DMSO/TMAO reductase YedYZ molybdopterin-dependent catalytic subunit